MIPVVEINRPTNSFPETFIEKVSNGNKCQKPNRIIQTCSWTSIWILVCIPSNILAILFYFKHNIIGSHAIDGVPSMYNNSNTTDRIYDDEIQIIQLNYSTNSTEAVNRK